MQKQSLTNLKKSILTILISFVIFSVFKCENKLNSSLKENLTNSDLHKLRAMSQEAFKQMPKTEDWDTLMNMYQDSSIQKALILIYVKKDILYQLGYTQLSPKEFGQNLRRYEETCDEIERIMNNLPPQLPSHTVPDFLLSSHSLNYRAEDKGIAQNP